MLTKEQLLSKKEPEYSLPELCIRFVFLSKNLIDLTVILPYFIGLLTRSRVHGAAFLRAFRLLRVLKLLYKFRDSAALIDMVMMTLSISAPALGVLVLFFVLLMIILGSIMYYAEGGTFTVNEEYPNGQYIRTSLNQYGTEISPFNSIPTCFYWVITTATTGAGGLLFTLYSLLKLIHFINCTDFAVVGYGDLSPTSWIGRAIANLTMMIALLVIALPISVVGSNFNRLYQDHVKGKWDALNIGNMEIADMEALFRDIDTAGSGYIYEKDISRELKKKGIQGIHLIRKHRNFKLL